CRTVNSRQFTHNSLLSTVRSHAFTLAETLIVMGIIGIVAALTIPNVSKNTGEAEKVARFKKIYAELNEAHDRATAVYGPVEKWADNLPAGTDAIQRYINRLSEFLKVQKSCGLTAGDTNCRGITYSDRYANYKSGGSDFPSTLAPNNLPSILLNSGASIYYQPYYSFHTYGRCDGSITMLGSNYGNIYCFRLFLDIDGPKKGKNTYGMDVFRLIITRNGIFAACYNESDCLSSGQGCGKWIMDFGNMDYLNANHSSPYACKNNPSKELGWGSDKAHSCK
ncbi:type II secretion system protein, partial [bacterium]|nr:type II secretion system protein [bacterium]